MAAGADPMAMLRAAMLAKQLSAGGSPLGGLTPPGGPAMAPSGALGQAPNAGAQFASQFAELQGADPMQAVNQLKQMKLVIARMIPAYIERLPGVVTNLSRVLQPLDGAIKEAEKAAQTLQTLAPPRQAPGPPNIAHSAVTAVPSGYGGASQPI